MSAMESETYKAPLFQAYMLGHGQKRKHSNSSIGLLSSPTGSRFALRAIDAVQSTDLQGHALNESSRTANSVDEGNLNGDARPHVRLGGDLQGEISSGMGHDDSGDANNDLGKVVDSYLDTIPFPTRSGRAYAFETTHSGDGSRKFPDPNNPPEIAAAVHPRKDPAPRFFGDAVADFYPWKGDEVEDKLTEQVIKTGLTDKFHVSGECNSANTTLGLYLKQPATLQNLSTLLVTAMQMREENSRVTAGSTFKPPPRVTLTDTRREAWLRDLADEAIPLRRLSRTIPHGIRGRLLLDHCLEKRIPVKRGVWLAQCVGANEIRAFRRKGVSGAITTSNERKWVQDWTTTLESFLETILQNCDKPGGLGRLNYATDLTRHLYSEQLVDREHFLHWSLSMMEQSKPSRLPLCLVILRVVWKDLMLSFRFGSRLIAALVNSLSLLMRHQKDGEVSKLVSHLQQFLANVIRLQPLAALTPLQWQSSRPCLLELLKSSIAGRCLSESRMLERNDRLVAISSGLSCDALSSKGRCYKILDDLIARRRSSVNIDKLALSCLETFAKYENLVLASMSWATTTFRVGDRRIYLVTRLIQNLSKRQYDTTGTILQCLSLLKTSPGISALSVTQLLSELCRANAFDIGRYLRWLIATGALNGCTMQDFLTRCDIRFLIELPSSKLYTNVASMRSMLLRKSGISFNENRPLAVDLIGQIEYYLGKDSDEFGSTVNLDVIRRQKHDFVIADIVVDWILRTCVESQVTSLEPTLMNRQSKICLGRQGLCLVLEILNYLRRHDAMERIISFYANSADMDALVALTQALVINHEELIALGTLHSLWLKLLGRYYHLRHSASPERHAITAIETAASDLRLPAQVMDYLKQELTSAGQHTVSIVYTPASEGMMDTAENNVTDSEEEIERILTATTNLDPTSVRRIFLLLVKKLMESLDDLTTARCSRYGALLSRLRALGGDEYPKLLNEFFEEITARTEVSQRPRIFKILVGGDVCNFVEIAKHAHSAAANDPGMIINFLDVLLNPVEGKTALEPHLRYNFLVQKMTYIETHSIEIVDCVIQAVAEADTENLETEDRVNRLLNYPPVADMFKQLVLANSKYFVEKLEACFKGKINGKEQLILKLLSLVMGDLKAESSHNAATGTPIAHVFPLKTIFESVDELSLPFWRLITELRLKAATASSPHLNEWRDEAVEAVKASYIKQDSFWTCLLSGIGDIAARDIFLFVANSILAPAKLAELVKSDPQISHRRAACSEILKSTAFAVRVNPLPEIALKAVTTLSSLYAHWGDRDPEATSEELREDRRAFTSYLQIVLSVVLVLQNTMRKSTYCSDLLQILCRFLATDISIFDSRITEFVFDVAASFTNSLESTCTLAGIAESLPESVKRNEAVQFLLGIGSAGDAWLHIAQKLPSHQHATSSSPGNSEQIYSLTTPFPLRSWELLPDAAPAVGPNDTALSLRLFDAKKLS